jgi:hypothetical protein
MDVTTSLKELSQQGHPVAGYKQLLARLFEEPARLSPPSAALRPILDVIVREEVNLLVSRQVLDELCNSVSTLPSEAAQTVLIEGTAAMITRAVSFEEQVNNVMSYMYICIKKNARLTLLYRLLDFKRN